MSFSVFNAEESYKTEKKRNLNEGVLRFATFQPLERIW